MYMIVSLALFAIVSVSNNENVEAGPIELPFCEVFQNDKMLPGWITDVSKGNTICVDNGRMEINAHDNTYAHIERPLNVDMIRVSCRIKPAGGAISWTTSLNLYWDTSNWCQIGILPSGTIYVTETKGGGYTERRLSFCGNEWIYVTIELARKHIRYLSSRDGENWFTEHLADRSGLFGKAPGLLIVGKGFGNPTRGYPKADMDNDFEAAGNIAKSLVDDITVVPTPEQRLDLTASEKKMVYTPHDWLGEEELAKPGDPTFDSVAQHFPPMKMTREITGVKDHPYELALDLDGAIEVDQGQVFFMVGSPAVRFGIYPNGNSVDADIVTAWGVPDYHPYTLVGLVEKGIEFGQKRLRKGYLPILSDEFKQGGLVYDLTVFGYSDSMSPNKDLIGFVKINVHNPGSTKRTTTVSPRLRKGADVKTIVNKHISVKPLADKAVYFKFPYLSTESDFKEISEEDFNKHLAIAETYWEDLLAEGMKIRVPEQRINDAYRAWLAYSFMNVRKRGDVFEPHDGTLFYNVIFGYSAALYCHALDLMGYHRQAQVYLDSLLTFLGKNAENDDRLFIQNYGLPDQGTLLFALSEHYNLTKDDEWFESVAPRMIKMCEWISEKRQNTIANQKSEDPCYGLIFYKPYCDEGQPAYSYYSDVYLALGMEKTASVLEQNGQIDTASTIKKQASAYRNDIVNSMNRSVLERDGIKMLPIFPQTKALLERANYTAQDYYTLISSCMLETQYLPADSQQVRWVTDLLEQKSGLLLGMCRFMHGIDHAYTYGYWMTCLERGDVERVILGLYGSLAYGMSQETYSPCETQWIRSGANFYHLPHLYSCTQQLRLLRNMLIREKGNVLLIGQAIPRHWLKKKMKIEVADAPTVFGEVDYRITVDDTGDRMKVRLNPPVRNAPDSIKIYLRHSQEKSIQRVKINGKVSRNFTKDTISLVRLNIKPVTIDVDFY